MKKVLSAAVVAAATAVVAPAAQATEGGGSQYPNGAEGFLAGAVPPPGVYLINYDTFYTTNRVNDTNGNKIPVNVSVDAFAEVPRLLWVTPVQVFGANWGMHILVPIVHLDATVGGWSKSQFGLGDITIDPFILSWHWKNFHLATGLDIILPTGEYDKTNPVNIGTNYWGFEPLIAGTYLSDDGWEVSAKMMYTINTTNDATNYSSGQAFHMDYTFGKHWNEWTFGVGGYYYQQTTDDELNGAVVGDGNRGMAFAIGPQVKYDFGGKYSVIAKWQHELVTENRSEGDKFWLKAIVPF
jgi:hypothetical protein